MRERGVLIAALLLFIQPAFAQEAETFDPSLSLSAGALVMPKAALPDPLEAGWKGEKICEALQETKSFRALKCTFAPGMGHERHFHAPHFGYILEGGKMRITDKNGTREQETPAGGSWKSDGIDWHEALNIGDTTAVYIIVEPKEAK
ncbi:MAG: cupin domain-containing protein [Pseudomonadota bacterium]